MATCAMLSLSPENLEFLSNLGWILLGASLVAAGVVLRRCDRNFSRASLPLTIAIFACITVVLFPAISISDDIAYFDYFLGHQSSPQGFLAAVCNTRREQSFVLVLALAAVASMVAASLAAAFGGRTFGTTWCVEALLPSNYLPDGLAGRAPPTCWS